MSKPETGAGNVELWLGEHHVELTPSLKACQTLSRHPGGIAKLVDRCLNYEMDAIQLVIEQGLGKSSKDLPALIYDAGLINLAPICISFLHIVANGGRPLLKEDDDSLGDDDPLAEKAED